MKTMATRLYKSGGGLPTTSVAHPLSVMLFLALLVASSAAAQRGHYIVDYQRLPLYQEFYLSPGLYRPLFPAKQEVVRGESRSISTDQDSVTINNQALVQQEQTQAESVSNGAVVEEQQAEQKPVEVPSGPAPAPSVPVLTYSNSMTPDGSYSYKYETADGLMREESSVMRPGEDGQMVASVRGSYSYPGPDGRVIRVDYVADERGFRATGDHLPNLADTTYNFKYVVP